MVKGEIYISSIFRLDNVLQPYEIVVSREGL